MVSSVVSVRGRREKVRQFHREGQGITAIARVLRVDYKTVARDFKALRLRSFSDVDQAVIEEVAGAVLSENSLRRGRELTEAWCLSRGLRVPRRRLEAALRVHRPVQYAPRKPCRRSFYNAVAPYWLWCMDQNEKLVPYRIYGLAVVDAFSRAVVVGRVTTALTGREHSRVFHEAVSLSGKVPPHVCVDKASAWGGVKRAYELLYPAGDTKRDWVRVDGERVPVKNFQVVRSVKNTPVERAWREFNDYLLQWGALFESLEDQGLLVAGARPDMLDLWCLHRVFLRHVKAGARDHWRMMNLRKKRKSTRNPDFPTGTHRPIQLIRMPGLGEEIGADDVAALGSIFEDYAATHDNPNASPWQKDPLQTTRARTALRQLMDEDGFGDVLKPEDDIETEFLLKFDVDDMENESLRPSPIDRNLLALKYITLRHYARGLRDWERT